ncbi:MAG: hypothetical protein V4447_10850 [Pseudomonadota bacterium]
MGILITVAEINKLLKLFEVFRHLDVEMPIGQLVFFLTAAKLEGASMREIADASGTKTSTASRYLANLEAKDQFRQSGLNLLHSYDNPANRRCKVIQLTQEGKKLLRTIIDFRKEVSDE